MIKASVQATIYSPIIASMQSGNAPWTAPKGPFYQLEGNIVPYSPSPTVLRIETNRVGEPIEIIVYTMLEPPEGTDSRDKQTTYTTVASSPVVTIGVQLGRGENRIAISVIGRPDDVTYLIVRATTIVALWEAFARVLYENSARVVDEERRAITSKLATRLIEPFVNFQDLLPDLQSLRILATRLAARGLIHEVGSMGGVNDLTKALTLSTPIFATMDKTTYDLYPSLDPWTNAASQYSGKEAHLWIPNLGIASWLAFIKYVANQPDLFDLLKISEREVVISYQSEIQHHLFDFDSFGADFLTSLSQSECFKSILISVNMMMDTVIKICAASYTFDLFIDVDSALGNPRRPFDTGINFDTGNPFDADDVDPFTDGWIGLSLSGRFEQDYPYMHSLDTFIQPSTSYVGPDCTYPGYYTQIVSNEKMEFDVFVDIEASGYYQEAIPWVLQSPDLTKWQVYINANTGTLLAVSGAIGTVSNFLHNRTDSTLVSFAITDLGEIQVIEPAGPGLLETTIYIRATDGSVWSVDVNDSNVIQTTKIFP